MSRSHQVGGSSRAHSALAVLTAGWTAAPSVTMANICSNHNVCNPSLCMLHPLCNLPARTQTAQMVGVHHKQSVSHASRLNQEMTKSRTSCALLYAKWPLVQTLLRPCPSDTACSGQALAIYKSMGCVLTELPLRAPPHTPNSLTAPNSQRSGGVSP